MRITVNARLSEAMGADQEILQPPISSRSSMAIGALFVVSLVLLLFLLNGGAVVVSWISSSLGPYVSIIEQVLAYLPVAGFAVIAVKYEGIRGREIGLTRQKFLLSLPVLGVLGFTTTTLAWFGNKLPQMSVSVQSGLTLPLGVVIFIVLIISIIEEFIFRGYVQVGTRRHFGVMAGLIVSSAVFALAHVPSDLNIANLGSGAAFYGILPTLAVSAVGRFAFGVMAFAVMFELTGNIFITIITHAFYDFTVVYYTPVGGNLSIVLVCLILPFLVVVLESFLMEDRLTPSVIVKSPAAPP
jgi:membrane protease YdiL (CAAX protease family)